MWTITKLLTWAKEYFEKYNIDSPRLTAELLLSSVLKIPRLELYLNFDKPLSQEELACFKELIKRRLAGEPLQYILGVAGFMGLDIAVNPDVLIPRPETELLVEKIVDCFRNFQISPPSGGIKGGGFEKSSTLTNLTIIDIGTGSGCIAIALKKHLAELQIYATDNSNAALDLARKNAEKHQCSITFLEGDLLAPILKELQDTQVFIVSNPPYVTEAEWPDLAVEIRDHEPRNALVAAENGLANYRRIVEESKQLKVIGFAFEVGLSQAEAVAGILKVNYPNLATQIFLDLNGIARVVLNCLN